MNMQNLMQQAQKMQNDIMKKKEEINSKEFTGDSELVTITLKGDKSMKSVLIKDKNNVNEEDLEILEDMVVIAFNDAIKKIDKETNDKLGQYGSALNGLM